MNIAEKNTWVDADEYPFDSNYFKTEQGRIHYIDEGEGEVLLFVHGTLTWSFLYRNYIKVLSKSYRCIAIDHLGFGMSEKPLNFDGSPAAHSQRLERLVNHLELTNITLVLHDFGGPIGLSFATSQSLKIKRIVLFNTWCWETKTNKEVQKIDRILGTWFGKWMYLKTNWVTKYLLKSAFYNKRSLTKKEHNQYMLPFGQKGSRTALYKIANSLMGASDWYEKIYNDLEVIRDKPILILWGMKDSFIKPDQLDKWQGLLNQAKIKKYEAGHFVQEEKPEQSLNDLIQWLSN